jgi:hypothetical protein
MRTSANDPPGLLISLGICVCQFSFMASYLRATTDYETNSSGLAEDDGAQSSLI